MHRVAGFLFIRRCRRFAKAALTQRAHQQRDHSAQQGGGGAKGQNTGRGRQQFAHQPQNQRAHRIAGDILRRPQAVNPSQQMIRRVALYQSKLQQ